MLMMHVIRGRRGERISGLATGYEVLKALAGHERQLL
jgi:hypothetical protein